FTCGVAACDCLERSHTQVELPSLLMLTRPKWNGRTLKDMLCSSIKYKGDKRYGITKLSESEFTISIPMLPSKMEASTTCSQYGHHTAEKEVEVTVLCRPTCVVKEEIQCEWQERIPSRESAIARKSQHTTTSRSPAARPPAHQRPREQQRHITTRDLKGPSSEGPTLSADPTTQLFPSSEPQTVTSAQSSSSTHSHLSDDSTRRRNDTISNATSAPSTKSQHTTLTEAQRTRHITSRDLKGPSAEGPAELGPSDQLFSSSEPETVTPALNLASSKHSTLSNTSWTSVSETTEITSNNHTEGKETDILNDPRMRTGGSSLLVFLVTCLIFGLLVVVIFFTIKLRRAHITWKRENEDSDPSEGAVNQNQARKRGTLKDKGGEGSSTQHSHKKNVQHPTPGQTSTKCDIKETEL
ncbi:hypothetical protein KUCAC02_003460, partial [Chaenocephalus aceratus]